MPLLDTDAIVLHSFDYLESSRILRLSTREGGVRSVLARGARRSSRRFGSSLDLFVQGRAQLHTKPGRELDTLASFDVTRSRPALASALDRFTGASALAELTLRFAHEGAGADDGVFDAVVSALDDIALAAAGGGAAREATLAGAWRIVAGLGFAPNIDVCGHCHTFLEADDSVLFSHPAGGAICPRCAPLAPRGRQLPALARAALRAWLAGHHVHLEDRHSRAHQRLLREFLGEHLADGRQLQAFDVWERDSWSAA